MDMERVKDIARYSKLAEKGWAEVENPGSQSRKNKKIRAIVVPLLTLLWILLFFHIAGWKFSYQLFFQLSYIFPITSMLFGSDMILPRSIGGVYENILCTPLSPTELVMGESKLISSKRIWDLALSLVIYMVITILQSGWSLINFGYMALHVIVLISLLLPAISTLSVIVDMRYKNSSLIHFIIFFILVLFSFLLFMPERAFLVNLILMLAFALLLLCIDIFSLKVIKIERLEGIYGG